MVTYDSLTDDEKQVLAAWERNMRAWIGGIIGKGVSTGRVLDAAHDSNGGAGDILPQLDPGEVVPNSSGIAGAQDLDTAEWTTMVNALKAFLVAYDTNAARQNVTKAAGPTAGL
jgi:hypothetical protein